MDDITKNRGLSPVNVTGLPRVDDKAVQPRGDIIGAGAPAGDQQCAVGIGFRRKTQLGDGHLDARQGLLVLVDHGGADKGRVGTHLIDKARQFPTLVADLDKYAGAEADVSFSTKTGDKEN